mmetsp:Transcript_12845/g.37739  ORF Transcript_12845/g.37739 Transcript_12845/m.37739 type:complete len:100 (-) Transcript_12845:345-644(-)
MTSPNGPLFPFQFVTRLQGDMYIYLPSILVPAGEDFILPNLGDLHYKLAATSTRPLISALPLAAHKPHQLYRHQRSPWRWGQQQRHGGRRQRQQRRQRQ